MTACITITGSRPLVMPFPGLTGPMSAAHTLGGKKLRKQWSACCPAHDDKSPSLIIFEGRMGAVHVRCMAGVEPIEIIAEMRWHEVADRPPMMLATAGPETAFQIRRRSPGSFGSEVIPAHPKLNATRGIEVRHGRAYDQANPSPAPGRETFDLRFWNQLFTVTVGFYADGTPGEVFIDGGKTGQDIQSIARDAAVVLSLALQHGTAIETIRHAVTRNGSGSAGYPGRDDAHPLCGAIRSDVTQSKPRGPS